MIRRPISLKLFITLAVLGLGIVIVLGFSWLSAHFFVRGMDNIVAGNMEKATRTYIKTIPPSQWQHANEFSGHIITRQWQQQPAKIQQAFGSAPTHANELMKYDAAGWFKRPKQLMFAMLIKVDGHPFYVTRALSAANSSPLVGHNARESMRMLLYISGFTLVVFALLLWAIFRRVSRPISDLVHWTRSLDKSQLTQTNPDFLYPELNEMAGLIKGSLSSVQDSLEREQQFLRYTSHELRTPISVIRSNIELLHKLEQTESLNSADRIKPMLDRIDRASLTMQHLTEVLLWLNREKTESLHDHEFHLDALLHKIVGELHYLLKDKAVQVELHVGPCLIRASEIATTIVLSNLIRNAFQHTFEGQVYIHQQGHKIQINNQQVAATDAIENNELGFGLGLQLTAQLCQKLGWFYENKVNHNGHHVTLDLTQPTKS